MSVERNAKKEGKRSVGKPRKTELEDAENYF
jgi:hypothetical protein